MPLFSVAEDKLGRVAAELDRLADYIARADQLGLTDAWSRTSTIAFTLHGAYTDMEDVMSDVARSIDGSVLEGTRSHQDLLEQMRAPMTGRRPALLDDTLYAALVELKGFQRLVWHHYGVDLIPIRTEANRQLMIQASASFKAAMTELEAFLSLPA